MSARTPVAARASRRRRLRRSPLTHLVLALVLVAFVQGFLFKTFQVPSQSMGPTLEVGDRLVASRVAYILSDPAAGDVAVFARPDSWDPRSDRGVLRTALGGVGDIIGFGPSNQDALVKRVIGEPGTTVRCCSADGAVEVDGKPLQEDYIAADLPFTPGVNDCSSDPASSRCFGPITVPVDQYLVLGDNRANSADSVIACRGMAMQGTDCARFVPRSDMIGKVVLLVWPIQRMGTLP